MYYPVGQIFAQNHSVSYGSEIFFNILFTAQIKDGCQKIRKFNFFVFTEDNLLLPCEMKICSKSVTVSEI